MKTIEEINAIRDNMMVHLENRVVGGKKNEKAKERAHILVCGGTGCTSGHSKDIHEEFVRVLAEKGLTEEIRLVTTGCFGLCAKGPIVVVYPDGTFYQHVKPSDVREIVEEHIIGGKFVDRLLGAERDENGNHISFNKSKFK